MSNRNSVVFVVDDEMVIASTLTAILNQSGYEAKAFTDPLAALDSAKLSAPDLLISDMIMPQMNGMDLAIRVQEIIPLCKMLLLSGQAANEESLTKMQQGGYHFAVLVKPVHPIDLIAAIEALSGGTSATTIFDVEAPV